MKPFGLAVLLTCWLIGGAARLAAQDADPLSLQQQPIHLQPLEDEGARPPVQPVFYNPQLASELPLDELEDGHSPAIAPLTIPPAESNNTADPLVAAKPRLIRDSGASITWLAPMGGFGITDAEVRSAVVVPIFLGGLPPMIVGSFTTHLLDGPEAMNLPSKLYSGQVELRWYRQVHPWLGFEVAAGPGWFSDFEGGSNGLRITGRALAVVKLTDAWTAVVGASYLGRQDLPMAPAGGLIWTSGENTKVELLIPRPRVMRRVYAGHSREGWAFAGFELYGGNSWSVTKADGSNDVFTYRDFRALVGYETKGTDLVNGRVEAGYVFGRLLELQSQPNNTINPGGTLIVRAGLVY